ncbi:hypothetical protein HOP50_04g29810 [Chloropicon primus]|uniref:HTH HARE-type domain-containing protein n=1 Tax=Chloropicon primus TaxID=1764295 RepID=A0A5B8MK59_9CHLO|nr:hypothetical protein A3770_04p29820 [Chloropicon primus]UPQ99673.1 hypothetical protein HOP50_04g29810 [Chloropicon primus]|eukprot:QDZ20464.1 hypothetical protein A3770_04p29820 [Chloropicon primus]
MIAARAADGGDDDKGGLSPGVMDMDVDGECLASFLTGSTTIIEEESDSEEDSGGADSSCQPETAQVTMMRDNARPYKTRNGKRTLQDAIYRILQDAGGSLRVKEILGLIQARDGSLSTDVEIMRRTVSSACSHSPLFVRTARRRYAIAKEYLNQSSADNLNEQNSNATTTNNNMKTTRSPSPSPYALDLREALESGLMTEEEYAEAVQEAQRYDSKSPEKKREIADYNEALRIIFAEASNLLSDKQQFDVEGKEVGLVVLSEIGVVEE